jgi:hypothetical protein
MSDFVAFRRVGESRRAPSAGPEVLRSALALAVAILAILPPIVRSAPVIALQPAGQTIFYGDPVTFRVVASGAGPLAYQWFRDGAPISAARSETYTISMVASNDHGVAFSVRVDDATGSVTSEGALLTVDFGILGPPQVQRWVAMDSLWRYEVASGNLGSEWAARGYNDAGWPSGPGLLYTTPRPDSVTGGKLATELGLTPRALPPTCYFRTHFTNRVADVAAITLQANTVLDDGVIVHLNGREAFRLGMETQRVSWDTYATRTVGEAAAEGPFDFPATNLLAGDNVLAAEVHQANSGSSDIVWGMTLDAYIYPRVRDTNAPILTEVLPMPGSTVASLTEIEVHFDEEVRGIRAADLLVNGVPAAGVDEFAPDVYVFHFPQPATGLVSVAWSPAQGVTDRSANSNRFAGGSYSFTLNPSAIPNSVFITEFMAANDSTIRDEDGRYSDWIELYNAGDQPVNLGRWYLTDDPAALAKWQFPPGVSMPPKSYLLVWASGQNRTQPAAPLHTSFKLEKSAGKFLGLVHADGVTIISAFGSYPQQYDDVAFGRDRVDPSLTGYFSQATPKSANATLGPGFGPEVRFSVASGTFRQPFQLALTTSDPTAIIRYFLVTNGASAAQTGVPDSNSPRYTGPLTISGSVQVRARAFPAGPGYFPGPLRNETYFQIADDAAGFSSDLPIVVFHDLGGGPVAATAEQFTTMQVFDTRNGRSSLLNPPAVAVQGFFHRRGQATFNNPKASLRVETQDAYREDLEVELLGMPAESDWVFYGINCFDKVLMHNPLAHTLYAEMGHYTSRTRFVEVYLKDDSGTPGPITRADYNGLYVLEEKIKIDNNRVNIDRLQPENTNAPSITGGYLLSVDKSNPGSPAYLGGLTAWYLDPDYYEINSPERAAQKQYVDQYFFEFYNALTGPNWTNPVTGYAAYIDLPSWIDYHLHNTFVFNVDMLRISSYFYKPRNGGIVQGPLWDFDRAFADSSDDRGFNPRRWRSASSDGGTDPFNAGNTFDNPWYGVMFTDPDFWQRWIDRYQELRDSVYSLTNLYARIDYFGDQVREATAREYARWRGSGASDTSPRAGTYSGDGFTYTFPNPGTWQGEVNFTKHWFSNRVDFMDTNFLRRPVFSRGGGPITAGTTLRITAPTAAANSTIYYTLDGTDPRLPGGAVSPRALSALNAADLVLTNNTRVVARNRNPAHKNLTGPNNPPISSPWSGPVAATFVVSTPALAVTEIMFNPAPAASGTNDNDAFEFIELKNVGAGTLNLVGARFTNGLDFVFASTNAITSLAPGQYCVLVRNRAAFLSRYPWVSNIAGQYTNRLNNAGERVYLEGAAREPILDFRYDNQWYPATDGAGFSLVIRNENSPFSSWTNAASWRASTLPGGSPGQADPAPRAIPAVVVNEVLTHTDPPQLDAVELHNPTSSPADISGWFLTDDPSKPSRYRVPDATVLPPNGYVVFDENQFNVAGANGFAFSSLGDQVYLFSADGTNLTGYRHGFEFGPQLNGATFGRHASSDAKEHFVTQQRPTLGSVNAGPRVGPVVINEIMYAPPPFGLDPDTVDEYVELRNTGAQPVPLYDSQHPTNVWRLDGAVQFTFPPGLVLAPGAHLLVVSFDPVYDPASLGWFRARYSLGADVALAGPFAGHLSNGGERLDLLMPDAPEMAPSPNAGLVPRVLVERVRYSDLPPWPTGADGTGQSLQRVFSTAFGDDPANWQAAAPTPGRPNPDVSGLDTDADGLPDQWELANGLDPRNPDGDEGALGDPDSDGASNLREYVAGTDPGNPLDFLVFDQVSVRDGACMLEFTARDGRRYAIETLDVLDAPSSWTTLTNGISGSGSVRIVDPIGPSTRFYRLKAELVR